jgi:hypothetical protein
VTVSELDDLEYSVDILTEPEPVTDISQLDHKNMALSWRVAGKEGFCCPIWRVWIALRSKLLFAGSRQAYQPASQ